MTGLNLLYTSIFPRIRSSYLLSKFNKNKKYLYYTDILLEGFLELDLWL